MTRGGLRKTFYAGKLRAAFRSLMLSLFHSHSPSLSLSHIFLSRSIYIYICMPFSPFWGSLLAYVYLPHLLRGGEAGPCQGGGGIPLMREDRGEGEEEGRRRGVREAANSWGVCAILIETITSEKKKKKTWDLGFSLFFGITKAKAKENLWDLFFCS